MNTLAKIFTRAADGLNAPIVSIEVHLLTGLPSFNIVGLPEGAVKESKERVRSALISSKYKFPTKRITVSLTPANLPKSGGRYDLGIAIGLLIASKQLQIKKNIKEFELYGELGLDGSMLATEGLLPSLIKGFNNKKKIIIPVANINDSSLITGADIYACNNLLEVCGFLAKTQNINKLTIKNSIKSENLLDFNQVKGQHQAKRAMEIVASGGHNLLLIGPPGAGKTMLAERLPSILPPLTKKQALQRASIYSIARQNLNLNELFIAPFRSPHHTCSSVALVGGGSFPMPGEISLSHQGVLFLDEMPEFKKSVLEVLRQPMENGVVHLSRAAKQISFPAKFQLIGAMNPCPCGYFGDGSQKCHCTEDQIIKYRNKISGPLLDRIDIILELPALDKKFLLANRGSNDVESSESIKSRVIDAYNRQIKRQGKLNDSLLSSEIDKTIKIEDKDIILLEQMIDKLSLSARSYYRIIKVARTIADLDKNDNIKRKHLIEALSYHRFNY